MLKPVLIAIVALLGAAPAFSAGTDFPKLAAGLQVRYDAAMDRLSLDAHDSPLTQVLARISRQSGVEILIDPSVDYPVTASLRDQPLENALATLTRDMNAVMIHDQLEIAGNSRQPVLVRMELLPVGETNTALLRPVLNPGTKALSQAEAHHPARRAGHRFLKARLQAWGQHMVPAQSGRIGKRETTDADRKPRNQTMPAERKTQQQLARLTAKLNRLQTRAASNPETSQQQRIQKISEKIARIQQRQEKAAGAPAP
jgi:hypothetical protein